MSPPGCLIEPKSGSSGVSCLFLGVEDNTIAFGLLPSVLVRSPLWRFPEDLAASIAPALLDMSIVWVSLHSCVAAMVSMNSPSSWDHRVSIGHGFTEVESSVSVLDSGVVHVTGAVLQGFSFFGVLNSLNLGWLTN